MRHQPLAVVAVAATVVLVAVAVVIGVRATGRGDADEQPAAPPSTAVPGTDPVSTRLPSPDDSYWTPERMRSARPAPMPTQ